MKLFFFKREKEEEKGGGTLGHIYLSASTIASSDSILQFALQKPAEAQSFVHVLRHKCTQLNKVLATNTWLWEGCDVVTFPQPYNIIMP